MPPTFNLTQSAATLQGMWIGFSATTPHPLIAYTPWITSLGKLVTMGLFRLFNVLA